MKNSRLAFIFLSVMGCAGFVSSHPLASRLDSAFGETGASEPQSPHRDEKAKHKDNDKDDSSWESWFEGWGDEFEDAFNGPKRTAPAFKWSGRVAPGKTFELRGVNGRISATPASGSEVELVAIRTGRRSDPESVKIEVVPHANGVTVCAVYPSRDEDRPNVCKPGGGGRMNVSRNDVNVEFEVRIPDNVTFEGRTVNGGIRAEVRGNAAVSTVNGSIVVAAGALTEASTVNGSIRATVTSDTRSSDDIKLSTVNGSVRLNLPEGIDANVSAKTVNGGISTDFDEIEVRKKWGPRSAEGRLGNGGRDLALNTVNGSIAISKGGDRE